jgi:hypothetical protein
MQLRDTWAAAASVDGSGSASIDAFSGLSRAALDMIGLAGFGYEVGALRRAPDDPSELNAAFVAMFQTGEFTAAAVFWGILSYFLPFLPTGGNRRVKHGREVMDRIGRQLIAERKQTFAYVYASLPMLYG